MSKKELSRKWIISLLILIATLVLAFSTRAFLALATAETHPADKADVQIIENKAKPSGSEKLILTKEITIGKLEKGGSIFNGLGGA
ncbi:MAG: hypothetical protein KA087_04990, partial [Candidatus Saccharicenans sp.]|nr:hypothetical protein [Candidatus Saccharicenans sp.]